MWELLRILFFCSSLGSVLRVEPILQKSGRNIERGGEVLTNLSPF
ncbi:hypothetical protein [Leptospira ainlahdjerensis]|nr:hypothetical protein [Leptospira ainlahdjerensis]